MKMMFAAIAAVLFVLPCPIPAGSEVQKDTRVTGTLHRIEPVNAGGNNGIFIESGYGLRLDTLIVFARGSKSERTVSDLNLIMSPVVQTQASRLEGRPVEATGLMECTMHFSPWTATCYLSVEHMEEIPGGNQGKENRTAPMLAR